MNNQEKLRKRFQIKIAYASGTVAYMCHKGRTEWTKETCKRHLATWVHLHGIHAEIVPANA